MDDNLEAFVNWNNRIRSPRWFSGPKFNNSKERFKAKLKCLLEGHR